MNAVTNDARFELQFINPVRYKDMKQKWEEEALALFGKECKVTAPCPTVEKQSTVAKKPTVSKYEQIRDAVPIHLKAVLTIREAAAYSNVGINKIDSLLRSPNCPFVLFVGTKKLVKRKQFEQFLSDRVMI